MSLLDWLELLANGDVSVWTDLAANGDGLERGLRAMVRQPSPGEEFQRCLAAVQAAEGHIGRALAFARADAPTVGRAVRNVKALVASAAAAATAGAEMEAWLAQAAELLGSRPAARYWTAHFAEGPDRNHLAIRVLHSVSVKAAYTRAFDQSSALADFSVELLDSEETGCFEHPASALLLFGQELMDTVQRWSGPRAYSWLLQPAPNNRGLLLDGTSLAAAVATAFRLAKERRTPKTGRVLIAGVREDQSFVPVGGELLKLQAAAEARIGQAALAPGHHVPDSEIRRLSRAGLRVDVLSRLDEAVRWAGSLRLVYDACPLDDHYYLEPDIEPAGRDLLSLLEEHNLINVRGAHGSGKSSILLRISHACQSAGGTCLVLDGNKLMEEARAPGRASDKAAIYKVLAEHLQQTFGGKPVDSAWRPSAAFTTNTTHYLAGALAGFTGRVLIVIDNCHRLFELRDRTDFFAMIRNWHNRRAETPGFERLWLVLATSVQPLNFLPELHNSPFNVGYQLILDDFSPAQCRELAKRHGIDLSEAQLQELHVLTGGLPVLIRRAIYEMSLSLEPWPLLRDRIVTPEGIFRAHLEDRRTFLRNHSDLEQTFLSVLRRSGAPGDITESARWREHLADEGFLRRRGSRYLVRCGLYENFLFPEEP